MNQPTLFFYDLETSGIYPDSARIMQFAGQRTDSALKLLGEPINVLIKLHQDILPDPAAILIHGITPQQTIGEGLTEAEFLREFYTSIAIADTTFVGFNNVRFDDEFMRYLNYRNLYDPFGWSWESGCSRWDMLDVARITRALRPEGINWPTDPVSGANVNRLELLASANRLPHVSAHDALSDVTATIGFAKLVKRCQPKLYGYLFDLRLKANAAKLVNAGRAFIYTSSHYPSAQLHTTAVIKVADHPSPNCVLVYDLRYDPTPWLQQSPSALADSWRFIKDRRPDNPPLPIKTLRLNRCPALAPLSAIKDKAAADRLTLDLAKVRNHEQIIMQSGQGFARALLNAVDILNREQAERRAERRLPPDARLYDSFYSNRDRELIKQLHASESPEQVRALRSKFDDPRLKQLAGLFLARNYSAKLTESECRGWDSYLKRRLFSGGSGSALAVYFERIAQLAGERPDTRSQVLLEDLKLYGESLVPSDMGD